MLDPRKARSDCGVFWLGFSVLLRKFKKIILTLLTTYVIDVIFTTYLNKGGGGVATIYLRDFDEKLHRKAKVKAAQEGITLKELIKRALIDYLKKKGG